MSQNDCVEAFLVGSDQAYEECAHGISLLDRIIIGCPNLLVGTARTALLPALYAYWERFVKLVFGEFLRAVELSGELVGKVNHQLYRYRLRYELRERTFCREELLYNIARESPDDFQLRLRGAREALSAAECLNDTPIKFNLSNELVETEANLRYRVLVEQFGQIGVSFGVIKSELEKDGVHIHPCLETLVTTRNAIAHGSSVGPTAADQWERLRESLLKIMRVTQLHLFDHLERKLYLRPTG